ncbi:MAG: phospholipid/cholesterol/gamma-HCH transport system substrate-binding protein [Thermoleophilaceae bacterium]|jgi:virulence factor Mce-like protein|nr:phospholipid/cholesterol/gamma-HCH transport system substrate-binding protein [Thermoleophilaceae bacterium]MEA2408115.1 phospholipid/cholesterol/gamma-HCH transport system substrate-binding protein [Thermoleophilaceae bacterium]
MIKQAPSFGRMFAMVAFTLSCVGILMFLWLNFGGAVPLQPEGYRVSVGFPSATQLAQEADVRISGVKVGSVKDKQPNALTGLTDTVLDIDSRYAPIPKDTRAILRQKTLLGETYVELSPGTKGSGFVPDGGKLAAGQVADTVELDEILRGFDPVTRARFSTWFDQAGIASKGNAEALNDALALLTPFAEDTDEVLKVLRQQSGATQRFVRDTGYVFDALSERKGQLRDLITNSNRTWQAIASRDEQFADTWRVLPTFLREGRATTQRLTRFADNTNPLIDQLRPAARQISPTLVDLDKLAPDLKGLFVNLDPLVRVSKRGLPATIRVLDNTEPLLRRLDPWLRNLTPIVDYLGLYRREIAAFLANDAAATQGREQGFNDPSEFLHYLRAANPMNPEMMTGWPFRLKSNRSNPYTEPGGYDKLRTEGHLEVFGQYLCTNREVPPPPDPNEFLSQKEVDEITQFVFGGDENRGKAPPCDPQAPLGRVVGQSGMFPRLMRAP